MLGLKAAAANPTVDSVPLIQAVRQDLRPELVETAILKLNMEALPRSIPRRCWGPTATSPETGGQMDRSS